MTNNPNPKASTPKAGEPRIITPLERKTGAQTPMQPKVYKAPAGPAKEDLGPQRYLCTEKAFVNGQMCNPGNIVQLAHGEKPSKTMKPVGPDGKLLAPTPERVAAARAASPAVGSGGQAAAPIRSGETPSADNTHVGEEGDPNLV